MAGVAPNPLVAGLPPVYYRTADGGRSSQVLYSTSGPESFDTCLKMKGCLMCDPYNCFGIREYIRTHHSVIVFENYIEINQPSYTFYSGGDVITKLYADDPLLLGTDKAGCCSPVSTHCSCCPTCFDMCGEGVVIHKPHKKHMCCRCGSGTPFCGQPGEDSELHVSMPAGVMTSIGYLCRSFLPCSECFCNRDFLIIWPVKNANELIQAINSMKTGSGPLNFAPQGPAGMSRQ
jgi:hypothetical protein